MNVKFLFGTFPEKITTRWLVWILLVGGNHDFSSIWKPGKHPCNKESLIYHQNYLLGGLPFTSASHQHCEDSWILRGTKTAAMHQAIVKPMWHLEHVSPFHVCPAEHLEFDGKLSISRFQSCKCLFSAQIAIFCGWLFVLLVVYSSNDSNIDFKMSKGGTMVSQHVR